MFASEYDRDEKGLILFPRDLTLRRSTFVHWKEAGLPADHPAKANLYLTQELIRYLTQPGDLIVDITAGSGSILLGAQEGRRVVAIELTKDYTNWMELSAKKMELQFPQQYTIINGDCREVLPINCEAIIFSPPYAMAMNSGGGILSREKEWMAGIESYRAGDKRNLGNLKDFLYNKVMAQIYQKCYDSLVPGGKLGLIIKDRIRKGLRVQLGLTATRNLIQAGFQPYEWHRWKPHGSMFVIFKKKKGERVVEDEHIIIVEKPHDST
jgi:DNA modification methylase